MKSTSVACWVVGLTGAGALLWRRVWRADVTGESGEGSPARQVQAKHEVLSEPQSLRATLARMEADPSYRPSDFAEGEEGLRQARERLRDAEALYGDLQTEGDA